MNVSLIITYDPAHEASCKQSVENVMKTVAVTPKFLKSKYTGVFLVDIDKPKSIIKKLLKLIAKNKSIFGKTHRYIPVDKWVSAKISEMQKAIKSLVPDIKKNEKWKMELDKRYYHKIDYNELIMKLTDVVDREKIDLQNPDKIIKVEIIGNNAAISILKPGEQLTIS
jgi:tRNA(Ser,Leu) C12 N-acetylase TAN1